MTLMRPRALLYSITFRISKVASTPSMLITMLSFLHPGKASVRILQIPLMPVL